MIGATTNCSVKRFTTRFALLRQGYGEQARGTEAQRIPCHRENVAGIPAAGVPATIIPATPLGVIQRERGGGTWRANESPDLALLLLNEFLQEIVAFILATVFPWAK